jgi:Pyridoxamine 5'-phosphate oxidase
MRWSDLEDAHPRLANVARERLIGPGVVLVATIRKDGAPRLSPVEPLLMEGSLWLSMLWRSRKVTDLLRDPRILVHSIITDRNGAAGEVKIRGIARAENDVDVQLRYADTAARMLGWNPEVGRFHLFEIDIDDVAYIRYDEPTGDQFVAMWPAGKEFVRRGTSATSVGAPEPIGDVLGLG